jgi:signal transduction histidine kinase
MVPAEKANILIVDDSPSKLLAMSAALAELDQNVVTALSGREALRHVLAQDFAVILLDVHMPDIDGFETASLIRERQSSAHTPIIFVTAYPDDTHASRGYSLGAVDYLLTPVVPEALRAKVSVFVELFRKNAAVRAQADERIAFAQEQAARLTAEAANRLKDEFLATLSHELRTPLNSILGWVQLLKLKEPTKEDLANGLEVIERNAIVQARIIEDLLDVSRIISGKLQLELAHANLADIAEAAVATVQLNATAKQITLRREFAAAGLEAIVDPTRLQQAIGNLLSNAVKFTPVGGTVSVAVRREGMELEVMVCDTGEGIAVEFLPYVFERFRQADASASRRHGGLGIGLALTRQLVEMHKGRISVESAGPGQGSTFRVRIPAARPIHDGAALAGADSQAGQRDPSKRGLAGVRVLVVDDQRDARTLLKRILSAAEAQVLEASSAAEAFELFKTYQPQLLVSDIGMPDCDGYELIRQVRAHPAGVDLPAIALTAYARPEERAKSLEAGFQTHVAKPVNAAELIAEIARLLELRELNANCNPTVAVPET